MNERGWRLTFVAFHKKNTLLQSYEGPAVPGFHAELKTPAARALAAAVCAIAAEETWRVADGRHIVFSGKTNQVTAMLLRKDGLDVIAIPQPSHAWLSGQLARAWGNQSFAAPVPREELCLAAELHDIGWLSWEEAPLLDAGTGLPQEFFKVPPKSHIALWREGVRRAATFGRYCALLVSLHADTIYGRYFDFGKAAREDAEAVRAFLDEQHRLQARVAASLRASPEMASRPRRKLSSATGS